MKYSTFRIIAAAALAALLAACGAAPADLPTQTAGAVLTGVATTSASAGNAASADANVPAALAANSPQPDCAAEGCNSLRIIDGNAEAFRYAAMRRTDADAS